jgi:hypothetical protein
MLRKLTKDRDITELSTSRMGPVSGVTFIYAIHAGHSTLVDHGWRSDPSGGPGARRRRLPH